MKYKAQSHSACLAYALWQIDAVDKAAVEEFEKQRAFESWESIMSWVNKYVPELKHLKSELNAAIPSSTAYDLRGKGIVTFYNRVTDTGHAISYEDGVVLDSADLESRLSLDEYLRQNPHYEVLKILPVEGE